MSPIRAFAFSLLFAAVGSGAAFADDESKADVSPAPVNPAIKVSRGDSWTYEIRDDVTGDVRSTVVFEVTKVTDSEIETRIDRVKQAIKAQSSKIEIFDTRWRRKDNGKVAFRPYLDGSGAPSDMEVGKSWLIKYEAPRKGSSLTKEFTGVGKVEAWERITLPSGTAYDAFKIDLKVSPSAVVSGHNLEARATMWFAPAVNRLVKRIDESRDNGKLRDASEQTLKEYKPAGRT